MLSIRNEFPRKRANGLLRVLNAEIRTIILHKRHTSWFTANKLNHQIRMNAKFNRSKTAFGFTVFL